MKKTLLTTVVSLSLTVAAGMAAASAGHGSKAEFGAPGESGHVDRVIEVSLSEMRIAPSSIEVKAGETIRFVVTNTGNIVHEFNIGTPETWQGHSGQMLKMMQSGMMTARELRHDRMRKAGMMHDDPNSVLLAPGKTAEVIWSFPEKGDFGFACNVPGHREAGMEGKFAFK